MRNIDARKLVLQQQALAKATELQQHSDFLAKVSEFLGEIDVTFLCEPVIETSDCTSFDCEASEAGIVFKRNGVIIDPSSSDFDCGGDIQIEVPWLNCEGERADGVIVPITANGVQGSILFDQFIGTTNFYTWPIPQSANDVTYTLTWGKDPDICSIQVTVKGCEVTGFKDLPSTTTFPPAVPQGALPAPGQVTTLSNGVTLECLPGTRHQYSKRSATNLNGTKYMDVDGGLWALPPTAGQQPIANLNLNSEKVWSCVDPDIIYGINSGTSTIWQFNCATGNYIDTGIPATRIGDGEGGISQDDQCIAINNADGVCIYNLQAPYNQLGCIPTPSSYNNHNISLDSQYVVVIEDSPDQATFYDRNMNPLPIAAIPNASGHGVMAEDCNDRQVYVYYDNPVQVIDLETGSTYDLLPPNSGFTGSIWHVSYSPALPGYVTISAANNPLGTGGWIGLVPICEGNTEASILSDAYVDATNATDYACQPKASAGKSGNQYVFSSCDADGSPKSYLGTCPS